MNGDYTGEMENHSLCLFSFIIADAHQDFSAITIYPPPISRWRDLLKVRVSFGGLMSSEVARGDLTVTHVRRSCREGTDCWSRPRQEGVGGGR